MANKRSWGGFMKDIKAKRGKKKTEGCEEMPQEFTVQRLSSEVAGKCQKYRREGPRVFVPFIGDSFTITSIKRSCEQQFDWQPGTCDILAGEQGPSCSSVGQIPNKKLIYIRQSKEAIAATSVSLGNRSPVTMSAGPIKTNLEFGTARKPPKSLTLAQMLKLGTTLKEKTDLKPELVKISKFDIGHMAWNQPIQVELYVEEHPFGEGAFRKAYKATCTHSMFFGKELVVKKYLPEVLEDISSALGQDVKSHTKKVVQMHALAKNFAEKLHRNIQEKGVSEEFGETLKYATVYMVEYSKEDEWGTVEPFVDGEFVKYINNNGCIVEIESSIAEKAQCLSHFSFEKSQRQLMVVDIQGSGYSLYDPEIASREVFKGSEFLFCGGNLSVATISAFFAKHVCNRYCKLLCLKPVSGTEFVV